MDKQRATVFVSYSHKDAKYLAALEDQLKLLKRKGYVDWWTDLQLIPGDDWRQLIGGYLDRSDIILLLVSIYFLASDFCWDIELARAIERHQASEARVIPVFVRSCRWQETPIESLQGVPQGGKPIQKWTDSHEAWMKVAQGIEKVVAEWRHARTNGKEDA